MSAQPPEIPRGIRNNNPCNIRRSDTQWLGLADEQTDPDFFQFVSPMYGIRAAARILKNYWREGVSTLREAITRWSPPSENNTQAYVQAVCDACGAGPSDVIDLTALLPKLIPAMIQHENGQQPYPPQTINYGIALA